MCHVRQHRDLEQIWNMGCAWLEHGKWTQTVVCQITRQKQGAKGGRAIQSVFLFCLTQTEATRATAPPPEFKRRRIVQECRTFAFIPCTQHLPATLSSVLCPASWAQQLATEGRIATDPRGPASKDPEPVTVVGRRV